jgi:MarR family transcriptional regulator, lower aerobic nicotinate degradation pathway regulator
MEPADTSPRSLTDLSTYLLSRVGKDARSRQAERLATRGLRLWHPAMLAALVDFGPQAQRDLAVRLRMDRSDVTKVVDELARAGYVTRTRDPADRRRVEVAVSPEGLAAHEELDAEARAVEDELLQALTPAERDQLKALLLRVFHTTHL